MKIEDKMLEEIEQVFMEYDIDGNADFKHYAKQILSIIARYCVIPEERVTMTICWGKKICLGLATVK